MNLDQALKYNEFFLLEPFKGFKKVGKLTGKYSYRGVFKDGEGQLFVEVKTGLFKTEWVNIDLLRPIEQRIKNNPCNCPVPMYNCVVCKN